jgi:hypothetical protein
MTGFKSKKTAAQDKLEQDAFNDWWGSDYDDSTNPCIEGTPVYWAWAGWQAALAQPAPVQPVPLTDDEIWKFWWNKPEVPEGEDDSMEAQFIAAVRAIEAAHGIKENT